MIQSKLDKAFFHYNIVYGDFKGLPRRIASDRLFYNKAINIAKNSKREGY